MDSHQLFNVKSELAGILEFKDKDSGKRHHGAYKYLYLAHTDIWISSVNNFNNNGAHYLPFVHNGVELEIAYKRDYDR